MFKIERYLLISCISIFLILAYAIVELGKTGSYTTMFFETCSNISFWLLGMQSIKGFYKKDTE